MKKIVARLLILTLGLGMVGPATVLAGPSPDNDEGKVEKERKKREEKALAKEVKGAKQDREILDEIQDDVDGLALNLLQAKYDDAFLQDYINEMGQSLVPREVSNGRLFSFRVIDDPSPNAYALPDGRIYVNTGLLVFVQNEAQLATVLGHEIGHVMEQHQIEAIKESRSFKKKVLPGLLGAAGGALVGAMVKGKDGAKVGAAVGLAAGVIYSAVALNSYGRKQEDEADLIGARLSLARGFDPAESATFFDRLATTFGDSDRFSNLIWGTHSRNVERAAHVRGLLAGQMADPYNTQRSAGKLSLGTGQMQLYVSRMFRDTAVRYMDQHDRYDIAKTLLEQIVDYRSRDPKTLWALGRVYKMVGRSAADKSKALDYLQRAASLDERNMYPYIYRDLGLMQARLASTPAGVAPGIESLRKYIRGHMDKYQTYPTDIEEMYDYLLIFGDGKWTAPRMDSVVIRASNSPEAPPAAPKRASQASAKKPSVPVPALQ